MSLWLRLGLRSQWDSHVIKEAKMTWALVLIPVATDWLYECEISEGMSGWCIKWTNHFFYKMALQWRHNELDDVSNHKHVDCLLNALFRRRSKKTSKLRVTDLCEGNSPVTGELSAERASNAENVSIWWRYHGLNNDNFVNWMAGWRDDWSWGKLRYTVYDKGRRLSRYPWYD